MFGNLDRGAASDAREFASKTGDCPQTALMKRFHYYFDYGRLLLFLRPESCREAPLSPVQYDILSVPESITCDVSPDIL